MPDFCHTQIFQISPCQRQKFPTPDIVSLETINILSKLECLQPGGHLLSAPGCNVMNSFLLLCTSCSFCSEFQPEKTFALTLSLRNEKELLLIQFTGFKIFLTIPVLHVKAAGKPNFHLEFHTLRTSSIPFLC